MSVINIKHIFKKRIVKGKMGREQLLAVAILLFLLLVGRGTEAQIAGMNRLSVLDMSTSGRTAALGFDYLPLYDSDLGIGLDNPSMIGTRMMGSVSLSYVAMPVGGNMLHAAYGMRTKHLGNMVFGLHYNGYGKFDGYDEYDNPTNNFSASDIAMTVGWGMNIDSSFTFGATFKPVLSQYESYYAVAVAFDIAGSYTSNNRLFSATLMLRNIGTQIIAFDNTTEKVPFELSAALSYRLKKAPFRLFFAATELQKWDLTFDDLLNPTTTIDPFTGEKTTQSPVAHFFDNMMRHTLLGVEANLGSSIFLRMGYSYRQMAETKGVDAISLSGFSFGFGVRKGRLELSYAHRNYNLNQAPNYFNIIYHF